MTPRDRIRLPLVLALGAILAPLAGHAQTAPEASFPVTVRHALGTTTIPARPQRIATVAWANQEVPLALGIVPVGMARANFGDDDGDGVLPWVAARLKELGAETPVLFDEGDGIDFEAVAATRPDVILAAHSGLTRADYETLSQIAPVVAYPDQPWTTGWRDMIRLDSAGMGMAAEGEALIRRLEGAGLLERRRDQADERLVTVHVTDAGRALRPRVDAARSRVYEGFNLPVEDAIALRDLANRFCAAHT